MEIPDKVKERNRNMHSFQKWAKTPPMGWNSWDCYGAGIDETSLRENAAFMAAHLKDYGWEYVVCDIQWSSANVVGHRYLPFDDLTMDAYGRLLPAENRFPSAANGQGFKPIAEYIHSLGLKFGLHMMRGIPRIAVSRNCSVLGTDETARAIAHTFSVCPWNTDMYGLRNCAGAQAYYDSVIALYASWGVDFIKCDDISVTEFRKWDDPYTADYEIEMLRSAIDRCGRKIVLSLSPGPAPRDKAEHLRQNANMWRMSGDFWDTWEALLHMFTLCAQWEGVGAPGSYPDCDMLPLGMLLDDEDGAPVMRPSRFTEEEKVTMMTLWCIFKSPLIMGGDLPRCDAHTLSLLTNERVLHMYRTAKDARQFSRDPSSVIWTANGRKCKYVAVFNIGERTQRIRVPLSMLLMPDTAYTVEDVWSGDALGQAKNTLRVPVAPHGARLLRIG